MFRTFWRYNYQALLWALFILVLCGIPSDQFDRSEVQHADLAIHTTLFGVLSFLLATGFAKQSWTKALRIAPVRKSFVIAVFYGVIVELLQGFVFTTRSLEVGDMVFNALGAAAGLSVFVGIYGFKPYW